jgi:glycosyltransferase involved in cell wall biosynthesis
MRIAIVSDLYPPTVGGAATHTAQVEHGLRQRGHEVIVVTLGDEVRRRSTDSVVWFPRRWHWVHRDAAVVDWLARNRGRYDVVYATGMPIASFAGARLAGKPLVLRATGEDTGTIAPVRAARDAARRRAEAVVAPSAAIARALKGRLGAASDIRIVPNGVDLGRRRHTHTAVSGHLRALYVGRLEHETRVEVLLHAVARVPGVVLEIVGDGSERSRLEVLGSSLGGAVVFSGVGSLATVDAAIARADVMVNPAPVAGASHALLEALAGGVPIVVDPRGSASEILRYGENGLALARGDARELAYWLRVLRDDMPLRLDLQRGATDSAEFWSTEHTVDELEVVLADYSGLQGVARIRQAQRDRAARAARPASGHRRPLPHRPSRRRRAVPDWRYLSRRSTAKPTADRVSPTAVSRSGR